MFSRNLAALTAILKLLVVFVIFFISTFTATNAMAQATATAATQVEGENNSVSDLIRILEDDDARAALLNQLRIAADEANVAALPENADPTVASQIAEQTRAVAQQMVSGGNAIWNGLTSLANVFSGDTPRYSGLQSMALDLLLTIGALFISFWALKAVSFALQRNIERRAGSHRFIGRALYLVPAALVDAISVLVTWGAGYLIALQVISDGSGQMDLNQTLLLNAFLVVEMMKLLLRLALEPRLPALRLLPMSDGTAAYWYFWMARALSLLGYTFMFFVPVLMDNVSRAAGQSVGILVMLTALVIAVTVVLQNREDLRARLLAHVAQRQEAGKANVVTHMTSVLANIWHLLAIAWLMAAFVAWMVNPAEALPFMLTATLRTIVSITLGVLVAAFIARAANAGMHLPDDIRTRLPLLEQRLQAYLPRVLQIIRALITIAVLISIAEAWALLDFAGWISSESGQHVFGSVFAAAMVVLVGFLAYLAMSSWVEYRMNPSGGGTLPTGRERTLLSLFRNAFTIALVVMVGMVALGQIGVNIAPLLAGAGVLGLAIGFGAQKLVQDIITGVFIQLENIMNEGDVVTVGGISGVVEKLTIRSVSIRSLDATLHLIPFSSVDTVSNMVKGFGHHVAEIRVAYKEDIAQVKDAMQEAFDLLLETEWRDQIIGGLEMQGITMLGESAITVRARIKTLAGGHWGTGRAYNELIKQVFDRRRIQIPFPHVTLHMGEDRTPPLLPVANGGPEAPKVSDAKTPNEPEEQK